MYVPKNLSNTPTQFSTSYATVKCQKKQSPEVQTCNFIKKRLQHSYFHVKFAKTYLQEKKPTIILVVIAYTTMHSKSVNKKINDLYKTFCDFSGTQNITRKCFKILYCLWMYLRKMLILIFSVL